MPAVKEPGKKTTIPTNGGVEKTTFKAANINEQAIYSRAFNAVAWGMAAVNFELLL
jgi:hypothetical protein